MKTLLRILGVATMAFAVATRAFARPGDVPEIDPNLVQTGLTVLVGGVLVLMGRRRK